MVNFFVSPFSCLSRLRLQFGLMTMSRDRKGAESIVSQDSQNRFLTGAAREFSFFTGLRACYRSAGGWPIRYRCESDRMISESRQTAGLAINWPSR
jgi:hypothetical protein